MLQSVDRTGARASVGIALAETDRKIERLESELEALRAVRTQLLQERRLGLLFPVGSGFVQQP